jgi:DNA primase
MDGIKDIIRNTISIQDVIASYITIIPFGKNYKACCPFHHEKTPSLHITPEKQMFYCFGCKKGGDVFTFVQEIEHVDFRESIKILAEKFGIAIHQTDELSKELKIKKNLHLIHEYATRFYQIILSKNDSIIRQIMDRGITRDSIKKWRIGYAPDLFYELVRVLQQKKFNNTDLISSGLVIAGKSGLHDRFRGRIMFPLSDLSGKVVGFSGRIVAGTTESFRDVGKYINSPETILYHKSKILFGFHHAKPSISQKKSIVLVEGQIDCILSHQSGHENTVALSGTACTSQHMEQIARFAREIIIATDNDSAGIKSAHTIAQLAYQFDCEVSLIILPDGKDPADMILIDSHAWSRAISERKDYLTFFSEITNGQPLSDRLQTIRDVVFPSLQVIHNQVYRDEKLHRIATILHVSAESIRNEFDKFTIAQPIQIDSVSTTVSNHKSTALETQIIELSLIARHFPTETIDWFNDHPDAIAYINNVSLGDHESYEHIYRYEHLDKNTWKIRLDTLWIRLRQLVIEQETDILKQKISQITNIQESQILQQQLLALRVQKEELIHLLTE